MRQAIYAVNNVTTYICPKKNTRIFIYLYKMYIKYINLYRECI